jgi:xanthosine utilization system XapX-like protein
MKLALTVLATTIVGLSFALVKFGIPAIFAIGIAAIVAVVVSMP